jgi:hypothetical protein
VTLALSLYTAMERVMHILGIVLSFFIGIILMLISRPSKRCERNIVRYNVMEKMQKEDSSHENWTFWDKEYDGQHYYHILRRPERFPGKIVDVHVYFDVEKGVSISILYNSKITSMVFPNGISRTNLANGTIDDDTVHMMHDHDKMTINYTWQYTYRRRRHTGSSSIVIGLNGFGGALQRLKQAETAQYEKNIRRSA